MEKFCIPSFSLFFEMLKDDIFAMFFGIAFHISVPLHVLVSVSYWTVIVVIQRLRFCRNTEILCKDGIPVQFQFLSGNRVHNKESTTKQNDNNSHIYQK